MTSRSFEPDSQRTVVAPNGAHVHEDHLAQSSVLRRNFHEVRAVVWCLVGNGLSNQTFIDAPEGIIAFDTGESVQEMALALQELRTHTNRPIAAVVYTHFHYVEGTQAVLDEGNHVKPLPIYGHRRISENKARTSGEIAPAYGRGLVEQFAIVMPTDGADGLVNVGFAFFIAIQRMRRQPLGSCRSHIHCQTKESSPSPANQCWFAIHPATATTPSTFSSRTRKYAFTTRCGQCSLMCSLFGVRNTATRVY